MRCFIQNGIDGIKRKANGTNPHGRTIAPTVIGRRFVRVKPSDERPAVPGMGITSAHIQYSRKIVAVTENGMGNGYGENGVIGETTSWVEKRELLGLDGVALINGSDYVTGNCSDHISPFQANSKDKLQPTTYACFEKLQSRRF
jgi:hypothetical protein